MLTSWEFFNLFLKMRGLKVELELHVRMWASALLRASVVALQSWAEQTWWLDPSWLTRRVRGAARAPGGLGRGSSRDNHCPVACAQGCAETHLRCYWKCITHLGFFSFLCLNFNFFSSEIIFFWVCEFTASISTVCLHVCTREAQGVPSVWQGCCGKTN